MVYEGLIMEVEKDYIVVLTNNNNYLKLKKKTNIDVGKKIMFLEEDIIKKRKNSIKPLIGIAAAIILLITTIMGQYGLELISGFNAYAIVSLDINPSLEFQVDKKEIVRKIKSLNDDGEELLDDRMIGMKIEEAILFSVKTALNKKYINDENNVVLISDVMMNSEENNDLKVIEDTIIDKMEKDEEMENINFIYVQADKHDLKKARESKVSIGKYEVYKILSDNNSDLKVEDIKDKRVSDIVKENKNLTKDKRVKIKKRKNEQIYNKGNTINSNNNKTNYHKNQEKINDMKSEDKVNKKKNTNNDKIKKKFETKAKNKDKNDNKFNNKKKTELDAVDVKGKKNREIDKKDNLQKHNGKKTKNVNRIKDNIKNPQENIGKNKKESNREKIKDKRDNENYDKKNITGKDKNNQGNKSNRDKNNNKKNKNE